MGQRLEILEKLCRCLAYHAVETELTSKFMTQVPPEVDEKIAEAKSLIADAGFDLDELYPASERPIVSVIESIATRQ